MAYAYPQYQNVATIKLRDTVDEAGGIMLEWELDQGWSDGYRNTLTPYSQLRFGTHDRLLTWEGGRFEPLHITSNIVVGVQSCVESPSALWDLVTQLYGLALPCKLKAFDKPLRLEIGIIVRIYGYIENLHTVFKEPYDLQTGYPFRAEVSFDFVRDYQAGHAIVDPSLFPYRNARGKAFIFGEGSGSSSGSGGGVGDVL